MFLAADHDVGNADRVAMLVVRSSATADFRPAIRMIAQAVADFASQVAEGDAMFGTGRCVRDDRAVDKLITPGVTELGLVGPQELVGVEELTVACRCVHATVLPWHGPICHDQPIRSAPACIVPGLGGNWAEPVLTRTRSMLRSPPMSGN